MISGYLWNKEELKIQKLDSRQMEDEKCDTTGTIICWWSGCDTQNSSQITTKPRNICKENEKNKHEINTEKCKTMIILTKAKNIELTYKKKHLSRWKVITTWIKSQNRLGKLARRSTRRLYNALRTMFLKKKLNKNTGKPESCQASCSVGK